MKKEFLDLCDLVIEASMFWSGSDEEMNPPLKTLRTLAGNYLTKYRGEYGLDKAIIDYLSERG